VTDLTDLPSPAVRAHRLATRAGGTIAGERAIPEETAIAITYDGSTQAVMMATPADLEDFAVGFSLTEGIVASPDDIRSLELVPSALGVETRMWLDPERGRPLGERRRSMAGPTGCGLCGIESLEQAMKPVAVVDAPGASVTAGQILSAMSALSAAQTLNREVRAVHAAGFWTAADGLVAVREDVGRHNALDKLVGALARRGIDPAAGVVLLTSRVSVELIQKTAALGAPILCAVSAPTALAVRMAEAAGITLVAIARDDGFEVFSRPERLRADAATAVGERVA
jgi:FdhD protein